MCEMLRWTVHLKGEPKRDDHAAVAVGHKVYSFGGYGQNMVQIEVHIFNTVSLRWLAPVTIGKGERPAEVPSRRYYHTAVLIGDAIYIWGGLRATESTDNVLYAFDVNVHKWFIPKVSGAIPDAKWGHSACALGKVIYIYGGYTQMIGCSNDINKLDTTTMVWSLIVIKGPPAPASARHSATIIGTKMFVFGGGGQYNKIYIRVFDLATNRWLSTPPTEVLPEGRRRHSAFSYNGELYIFGGHNLLLDYTFNDLWKFNPETFSWKRIDPKGKPSCWSYGMCCCMVGDRVIFFGGFTPNDLYILDLSPSLNTLCKLVVIEHKLDQSLLPQDIKWELETMTSNSKCKNINTRTRMSVLTASQPT